MAALDLQALQAHRAQANPDLHFECYQRYVPSAYQSFWQRHVNAERKLN